MTFSYTIESVPPPSATLGVDGTLIVNGWMTEDDIALGAAGGFIQATVNGTLQQFPTASVSRIAAGASSGVSVRASGGRVPSVR